MKHLVPLILVLVMFSAFVAKAVTVTDVTTNAILFHDGFESGDFSSPTGGTWTLVGPDVTVTNASTPGPAEGSYYARLFRDSNTNSQGNLRGTFSPAITNGDVIRLQMMIYLPSAGDTNARGQFMLDDGDFNTARAWVRPDGSGNVIAIGPGITTTDTGLNYLTDTWQLWELDYTIGSSTFSVSVDGDLASGFASYTAGSVSVVDLFNGAASPSGTFFIDAVPQAVPEPGSWAVATLCVLALAGMYRRRRPAQR
jgi:hypothetical protein